jgi:hypothetical protein
VLAEVKVLPPSVLRRTPASACWGGPDIPTITKLGEAGLIESATGQLATGSFCVPLLPSMIVVQVFPSA